MSFINQCKKFTVGVFFVSFLSVSAVGATPPELDVEGARNAYNREKSEADAAYSDYLTKKSIYDSAQSDLNQANQRVRYREQELKEAEGAVDSLNARIAKAERDKNDLQADIDRIQIQIRSVDSQLFTEQSNLLRYNRDREQKERKLERVNEKIHDLEHKDPNSHELEHARQEKAELERDIRDLDSKIRTCENRIQSLQNDRSSLEQRELRCRNDMRNLDTDIASYTRERDRAERTVRTAESELQLAKTEVVNARSYLNQVTPPYEAALAKSNRESAEAKNALAHFERVQANYQAARTKVLNAAHADAVAEAEKEAQERAAVDGAAVGANDGKTSAVSKARGDIAARDLHDGYWQGRSDDALMAVFSSDYQQGRADGVKAAERKAASEDFAKGFNQAFTNLISNPPANTEQLDAAVDLGQETAESGAFLSPTNMPVNEVKPPSFAGPLKRALLPPVAGTVSVSAPGSNRTYYDPNCENVILPEFGPECKRQYDTSFQKAFSDKYVSVYQRQYQTEFNGAAANTYRTEITRNDAGSLKQGQADGVRERGVLDGFGARLATAQREQFQAGEAHLDEYLKKGALVIVRSAELKDSSGDGLLSPGEKAQVQFVVDNYGKQSTRRGALDFQNVQLEGLAKGQSAAWSAIPPSTRLTLKNAYSADVMAAIAGAKLAARGKVTRTDGGGELSAAEAKAAVAFAYQLEQIALERTPKLNETVNAKFRFTNKTAADLPETTVSLRVSPAFMEVEKAATPYTIPALAAGASVEVAAKVKALPFVGENTDVNFYSDVLGAMTVSQHFPQRMSVDRTAALLLFDRAGKEVPDSTLRVSAGTTVSFGVQIKYLRKTNSTGEIAWSVGTISDPSIRAIGTTGVNYGIWTPSRKADVSWVQVQVPATMRGKTASVMVNLREGRVWQHTLPVYLDIQ